MPSMWQGGALGPERPGGLEYLMDTFFAALLGGALGASLVEVGWYCAERLRQQNAEIARPTAPADPSSAADAATKAYVDDAHRRGRW